MTILELSNDHFEDENACVTPFFRTLLDNLIISVREIGAYTATIVIGRPGFPNAEQKLRLADAVLYETPEDGTLDIRVLIESSLYNGYTTHGHGS